MDKDNNLKASLEFENDTVVDFLTRVIGIEEEPVLVNQKTARQQKIKDLLDSLEQKGCR